MNFVFLIFYIIGLCFKTRYKRDRCLHPCLFSLLLINNHHNTALDDVIVTNQCHCRHSNHIQISSRVKTALRTPYEMVKALLLGTKTM